MASWIVRGVPIAGDGVPRIMGIVNATPDSFSDGGRYLDPELACAHALALARQGAEIIDVGGESSRPGAAPVAMEEELRRVLPVLEQLAGSTSVPISIDTTKPEIASRALAAGASIINDIGGLRDPGMLRLAAECDAGIVVMHMAGTPATMQDNPSYEDVSREVYEYLARTLDAADRAGIALERICIDPGIGFGKTYEHNVALLRALSRLKTLGRPVLVGLSRKRILGKIVEREIGDRLTASVTSSLAATVLGADVVRVHDVAAMRDALRVWQVLVGWNSQS